MSDWYDKQVEANAEGARGPRLGFTDPNENRRRRMRVHQDTFLIFRSWQGCYRCKKLVEEGVVVLPETADITCPHTRHDEYVALLNKLRNAERGNAVRLSFDEFNNERGERYAAVTWEEPEEQPNEAEARARGVPLFEVKRLGPLSSAVEEEQAYGLLLSLPPGGLLAHPHSHSLLLLLLPSGLGPLLFGEGRAGGDFRRHDLPEAAHRTTTVMTNLRTLVMNTVNSPG